MNSRLSATPSLLTRPSLLFRLRDWKDSTSWREFDRLYRRFIYGLATRSGLNHEEAEDVVQEVLRHVADKITEFEARSNCGSFRRWLMNQTRWRIADKFRERGRAVTSADMALHAPNKPALEADGWAAATESSSEAEWEAEWQHHLLEAAFERLARRVPAKHFQAFQLYTRHGWTVGKIAHELGLSRPTVYLLNHRLTKLLRADVERLQRTLR